LHDLNSNLKEPRIFVNNVLQLRFEAAAHTATRFVINSTVGLGGLLDVATREGIPQESGDFGQTLFVWGVAEGPYVVRPYLVHCSRHSPGTLCGTQQQPDRKRGVHAEIRCHREEHQDKGCGKDAPWGG
jgi:ABC-type transporter lipoprotein component MlaA